VTQPRGAAFPREYPAVVIEVTDGDTADVFLDRGGDDWWKTQLRFLGCACREKRRPGGPEATAYTTGLVAPIAPTLLIDMFDKRHQGVVLARRWDKFGGRVDGILYLPDGNDVSTLLIRSGYAAPWDGRGTQPEPPWPIPGATGG
jgi:endonuclease YncB( thermonuclease family)